jgi:hypothetical protein
MRNAFLERKAFYGNNFRYDLTFLSLLRDNLDASSTIQKVQRIRSARFEERKQQAF